jgi:enoyl-CoA hydratase
MPRLAVDHSGTYVTLRLDAPQRRNALDLETMVALVAALRAADDDPAVRAVVLTGSDPAFCAGLDLAEIAGGRLDLAEVARLDADPWRALQQLTTPTIAAVNGPAVTGGLELVLCCDLAIASDQARFADTHARVGIHPSGGLTVLLPRYIGLRQAFGMSLTGRFVDAHEAAAMGLVNTVVRHDQLEGATEEIVAAIVGTDPVVLSELLTTYRLLSGVPLEEALHTERERGRGRVVDPAAVEARRQAVIERGRQLKGD